MGKLISMRTVALLILIPTVIISMIILGYLGYVAAQDTINEQINREMNAELSTVIETVEKSLYNNKMIAQTMARGVESAHKVFQEADYNKFLTSFIKSNDETFGGGIWFEPYRFKPEAKLFSPYCYRESGQVKYTTEFDPGGGQTYLDQEWYQTGAAAKTPAVWSLPYLDGFTKISMVTTSSPFYDESGKLMGVATTDIELTNLQNMIMNFKVGENGRAFLLDSSGIYIGDADSEKLLTVNIKEEKNAALAKLGEEILNNESGTGGYDDNGVAYKVWYATVPETGWHVATLISESELYAPLNELRNNFGLTILICILFVSFIIVVVMSVFVTQIKRVNKYALSLSEGDLTLELTSKSRNEIGHMSRRLNSTISKFREIIHHIKAGFAEIFNMTSLVGSQVNEIKVSSNDIMSSMGSVTAGCEQQSMLSDAAKLSMRKVQQIVNESNDNLDNVLGYSTSAYQKAEQGNEIVTDAVNKMSEIDTKVTKTSGFLSALTEDSKKIATMVNVIKGVARQTNILALNANIEAARAGSHGRGFAVVADEVRTLAVQSATATEDITVLLTGIQKKIFDALESSTESAESAIQGAEAVKNAGSAFQTILQEVETVKSEIESMSKIMKEIESSSEIMQNDIVTISDISKQSTESARSVSRMAQHQVELMERVADATNRLSDVSKSIETDIGQFKVD